MSTKVTYLCDVCGKETPLEFRRRLVVDNPNKWISYSHFEKEVDKDICCSCLASLNIWLDDYPS